jgi:predicted HicB family RNase H-like nuclease
MTTRAVMSFRLSKDLLALAKVAAASRGKSVNAWIAASVRSALLHQARRDPALAAIIGRMK